MTETQISKTKSKQTVILNENEFYDREGNLCTRVKPSLANQYEVPEDVMEFEPDFSFQWIRHSCKGNLNMNEMAVMQRAGWRSSSPAVFNSYFIDMIAPGEKQIILDGLILMERPKHITEQAKREAENAAFRELAKQTDNVDPENFMDLPSGVKMMKREIDMGRYEKIKVKPGRKKQNKEELNFSLD